MATTPIFTSTSRYEFASLSAANTAINGTGTITALISGDAAGTKIFEIDVQCSATSAAALVNIFITKDSGTTWVLFDQITVTAATSSTTVKASRSATLYNNLILPNAATRLGCTTTIAQATNVNVFAGDLT